MIWNEHILKELTPEPLEIKTPEVLITARKKGSSLSVEIAALPRSDAQQFSPVQETETFVIHENGQLALLPALPDLPTVLTLDTPLALVPGASISGYLTLPVILQFIAFDRKGALGQKTVLKELPAVTLSKTWFGDPVKGELCYNHTSAFDTSFSDTGIYDVRIPITMENNSQTLLSAAKICIHTEFLEIFITEKGLLTSAIDVRYQGEEQKSVITLTDGPPDPGIPYRHRIDPRKNHRKGFVGKTFDVIRQITGM